MKRSLLFSLTLVTALAASATAFACDKDIDCKGQRVCEAGRCVAPAAPQGYSPAAVAPQGSRQPALAVAPQLRRSPGMTAPGTGAGRPPLSTLRGYGSVLVSASMHGWGKRYGDDSYRGSWSEEELFGVKLAGYGVLGRYFHLGGFFSAHTAKSGYTELSVGPAMKVGGWATPNLFISYCMDTGFYRVNDLLGINGFTGVSFDLGIAGTGAFRFAGTARLGFQGTVGIYKDDAERRFLRLRAVAMFGVTFGG